MNKCAWIVVAMMTIAGLAVGCGGEKTPSKGTNVGVVDFPSLLSQLGYQQKMEDKAKMAEQQLRAMQQEFVQPELKNQATLQQTLDAAVRAVAKSRPDADKETLGKDPAVFAAAKAKYEFDQRLRAYANQYQQALDKYKQSLLEAWTAACLPAMGKVGPARGVEIIMPKQGVPWNSPDVDLTPAMAEYIKTNNQGFEFPPLPDWKTVIVPMDKITIQTPG
jgi:Skp family chaperone for outer membrane proteins